MKNTILIQKAENQVRQQLISYLSVLVILVMVINAFIGFPGWLKAATDQTNLSLNIGAGSFSISNAPTSIEFAAQTYGLGNNFQGNSEVDGLTVMDWRGNSQAWTVAVNSNNFHVTLPASDLTFNVQSLAKTNINTFEVGELNLQGTNFTLNDAGGTLMNASTAGSGVVQVDNGAIRMHTDGNEPAGTYTAVMTYTLS